MGVKLKAITCPQCGANLSYEEGRKVMFCEYCGSKIILDDDSERTYRYIDEAKVKQAETEQMVKMRQLDMQEDYQENNQKDTNKKLLIIGSAIVLILGIISAVTGEYSLVLLALLLFLLLFEYMITNSKRKKRKRNINAGLIKINNNNEYYRGKDYKYVENAVRNNGFKNVSLCPMDDLSFSFIQKPGKVDSVLINGMTDYSSEDWVYPDSPVIIQYHSMKK